MPDTTNPTSGQTSGPTSGLERAIDSLTRDHDEVRAMFRDYKALMDRDAPAAEREQLAARICNALTIHAELEERFFYPAAREIVSEDSEDIMDHAEVEHGSMKALIAQIEASDPDDPLYDANVHVLGEYVAHHVREEEDEMFSELRQEDADMEDVATAMQAARDEFERYVADQAGRGGDQPVRATARSAAAADAGDATARGAAPARKRQSRGAARKSVKTTGSTKQSARKTAARGTSGSRG